MAGCHCRISRDFVHENNGIKSIATKSIELNALEHKLEWIDSALMKMTANFSTAVAKAKSNKRKYLVKSSLRRYT